MNSAGKATAAYNRLMAVRSGCGSCTETTKIGEDAWCLAAFMLTVLEPAPCCGEDADIDEIIAQQCESFRIGHSYAAVRPAVIELWRSGWAQS